jgi:hypothetical protein
MIRSARILWQRGVRWNEKSEDRDGSGAKEGEESNKDGRSSKKARTKNPVVAS